MTWLQQSGVFDALSYLLIGGLIVNSVSQRWRAYQSNKKVDTRQRRV